MDGAQPLRRAPLMHAMVLNEIGAALDWTELRDRQPGPGQIRIAVAARVSTA